MWWVLYDHAGTKICPLVNLGSVHGGKATDQHLPACKPQERTTPPTVQKKSENAT